MTIDGIKLLPIVNKKLELKESTTDIFYDVNNRVKKIEETYGGKNSANNLASEISNLVVTSISSEEDRIKAASLYKNNTGKNADKNNIANIMSKTGEVYKDICDYYEFIQFKRAHFDCKSDKVVYNQNTGRITSMTFEFNGRFE